MTTSSQQYAHLSEDSYRNREIGWYPGDKQQAETIGGVEYRILAHANNGATGYQGTVYQRTDTGEIVVAHRGTEFKEQFFLDALTTDGSMLVNRTNPQAQDAIELTKQALAFARSSEERTGRTQQVTITGHSLGGALAQISAHHFGLGGETFNAYGAASLGYRIPEGGRAMVNHVIATDPVSAASPHYGEVRVYAQPDDINRLQRGGFSNSRVNMLMDDYPLVVAGASFGAHKMHNFLNVGADGRPDRSVLEDPQARQRAVDNARMIDEYRDDLNERRAAVSVGARLRDPVGTAKDAIDIIRGPLDPGAPAQQEAPRSGQNHSSLRIDDPRHDGNRLFQDAERGVHALDAKAGRAPDEGSRQLAGVLAAEMHSAGGQRIDTVVLGTDGTRAFAVQGRLDDPAHLRINVATVEAMQTPLENSTQRMDQSIVQQQAMAQQQSQQQERQHNAHSRAMA